MPRICGTYRLSELSLSAKSISGPHSLLVRFLVSTLSCLVVEYVERKVREVIADQAPRLFVHQQILSLCSHRPKT